MTEVYLRGALDGLVKVLQTYGYDSKVATADTETHWAKMTELCGGDWMKVAKYKLSAFYSYHNKQPLPQCPWDPTLLLDNPKFLLGGGIGRFLTQRLRNPREKESILQTVLQSKRGMPRPSKETLKRKESEFLKEITTEMPQMPTKHLKPWADVTGEEKYQLTLSKETAQEELRRTVKELFEGERYTMEDRLKVFFPSTSANYIRSRKQAGAIGEILDAVDHPSLLDGLRQPGGYLGVRRRTASREEGRRNEEEETGVPFSTVELVGEEAFNKAFSTLWFRILKGATQEDNMAEPVALAEALKVRIITKGGPFRMTAMRNLWKKVHSVLRRHRVFKLIGETVTEEVMLDGMGRSLKEDEFYLSGDYANATNNLHSWVSETIAEELAKCLHLSTVETTLFIESLTKHTFWVPEDLKGETGETVWEGEVLKGQKRGQLMGSITSFPILCIANAALCRWAMEVTEDKVKLLRDCQLLINGDDCALKGKATLYKNWSLITAFAGLEESMGKTYFSKEFVNINSTSFTRGAVPHTIVSKYIRDPVTKKYKERETYLSEVRYVNAGLLLGIKRSGQQMGLGDLAGGTDWDIGTRAKELLRQTPTHMHERVMRVFINQHRDLLNKARVPWYIPQWLGGLGIPEGAWGEASELDRRVAHRILLRWKEERPQAFTGGEKMWRTWQESSKRLGDIEVFSAEKGEHTEQYNQIVAKKCVDLLFTADVKLTDLRLDLENTEVSKGIAKNAKLWKPSHGQAQGGSLPRPLPRDALLYQKSYANFTVDDSVVLRKRLDLVIKPSKKASDTSVLPHNILD